MDSEGTCDVLVGINDDVDKGTRDIGGTCDEAIWKGISDDVESERLCCEFVLVMLNGGGLSGISNCNKSLLHSAVLVRIHQDH